MSLEQNLTTFAEQIGTDVRALTNAIRDIVIGPPLSVVRSGEDANGLFTVVSQYRGDASIYKESTLSGGSSPSYTTRTVQYYDTDGVTVISTQVYTLTYNANGILVSEILQS